MILNRYSPPLDYRIWFDILKKKKKKVVSSHLKKQQAIEVTKDN